MSHVQNNVGNSSGLVRRGAITRRRHLEAVATAPAAPAAPTAPPVVPPAARPAARPAAAPAAPPAAVSAAGIPSGSVGRISGIRRLPNQSVFVQDPRFMMRVVHVFHEPDEVGLSMNKISKIPKVQVTRKHVAEKLQCSVCREDFQLKERVLKLPCLHIHHESCIVQWLQLNGTCPLCRRAAIEDAPVLPIDDFDEVRDSLLNNLNEWYGEPFETVPLNRRIHTRSYTRRFTQLLAQEEQSQEEEQEPQN